MLRVFKLQYTERNFSCGWLGLATSVVSFSVVGPYNIRGFISCGWALQHSRFHFLWLGLTTIVVSFPVVGPYNIRGFNSCGWALQHSCFHFLWLVGPYNIRGFISCGWALQHSRFHFLWLGLTMFAVSFLTKYYTRYVRVYIPKIGNTIYAESIGIRGRLDKK